MVGTLIIADDLTGALDSAVAFACPAERVRVLRDVAHLTADIAAGVDVLCINTNSREGSAAQAVDKIRTIAQRLDLYSVPTLLKKVDSRLKGHIKAEVAALSQLSERATVIAVPAIPDMGRIQQGGYLRGVGPGAGLIAPVAMADKFPSGAVIPNVEGPADFDEAISAAPRRPLWVGARGVAFALARAGILSNSDMSSDVPRDVPTESAIEMDAHSRLRGHLRGPLLVAVGSRDPITVAQVDQLEVTHPIQAAPNGAICEVQHTGAVTTIQMVQGAQNIPGPTAGAQFSSDVCAAVIQHQPKTLLVCGGETANAILDRLSINTLDVTTEICSGLPLCRGIAPWGPIDIVTKSGGFGAADLLSQLVHLVKCDQDDLPKSAESESL